MNPFRKIANSLMNWWKGETAPEVSDSTELTGGVMTLNSPSFLESMGLSRRRKTTSEVTYFTCLKMLSETLAKMPIKYYQRTDKGIIEAEQTDTSRLLTKRPNPFMTPTVFWNTVEINRNHYGNAYVYMRKKFIRKKYGGEVKILDLWVMQSNCVQIVVDDAGIFAGKGRLSAAYQRSVSCESSSSVQLNRCGVHKHRTDTVRNIRRLLFENGNGIRHRKNPDRCIRK